MALHQRSRGAWHHWAPSKKRPVLAKIFNHSPDNAVCDMLDAREAATAAAADSGVG